ncbi:MAG: flagellar protein FliO/FliZ [Baekduia sp.]|nr:flagellar protein FliO/FliZ [Baekduia sp.]MDX6701045.1 flagellar protein FliO/FliZ [Baekduia sp.]
MKPHRALTAALAVAPLCVLLAPATVLAATKDTYGEQTPLNLPVDTAAKTANVGGGSGGSLARTFVGLAVVVAVIYGLTWVLRQMKKSSSGERSVGFGLSTEASMPLGPGRSVHLIRAGRELVLVGSAEHGIVPIRTYTEDEAHALGLLSAGGNGSGDDADGPGTPADKAKATIGQVLQRLRERTAR